MSPKKGTDEYNVWKKSDEYKVFVENRSGEKNGMFGKKRPDTVERNKQHSGKLSPNYGIHRSQETKDKMSKAQLGKSPSQETRDKISKTLSGENNPNFGKRGEECSMFGKHHSQESKDKIRQSNIGKHMGEKNYMFGRTGENNPRWGTHHSQATKNKMSQASLGKPKTQEHKDNVSKALKGKYIKEKNPNWQGGTSFEPYTSEFNKQLKELIRSRDGYKCQKCGCSEIENRKKLSIHHIDYDKKNCLPENLITLCSGCNGKVNTNKKKWTNYFQEKLAIGYEQKQLCLARL